MRETTRTSYGAAMAAMVTSLVLVACHSAALGGDGNNVNQNTGGELCGNGVVDDCEACDDGNHTNGDGCTADCHPDAVVLATGQDGPGDIAVDATHVYWTSRDADTVMKVPIAGGAPTTLASGQEQADAIAVSATHVYWIVGTGHPSLMKAPLAGGAPTEFVHWASGPITLDATFVYFDQLGGLMKIPLAGGEPSSMANGGGGSVTSIVVDATHLYWTNFNTEGMDAELNRAPLVGGDRVSLLSGSDAPWSVAVDATHLYWTDNSADAVKKMPLAGGPPTTLASGQRFPIEIEVDATHVYWLTHGFIMKVPLAGGCPCPLATGLGEQIVMATDATHVYWTDREAGTVMKVHK